jgi:hypothetical protein
VLLRVDALTRPVSPPLAAAILTGMAGGITSPTFTGRAEELQRLDAALDRADQGRPRVVLLG